MKPEAKEAETWTTLQSLTEHSSIVAYFDRIKFYRVRSLYPLAGDAREDTAPRAARRCRELPSLPQLEQWYAVLSTAINTPPDDQICREIIGLMMDSLRGKLENRAAVIESFVICIRDVHVSPQIISGAVKKALTLHKSKPAIQTFIALVRAHRAETKQALDDVCRTIGLRKDAEKVRRAGSEPRMLVRVIDETP